MYTLNLRDIHLGLKVLGSLKAKDGLVELNWIVNQFMQYLEGTWTELQLQVLQELDVWTKFSWKGTFTALRISTLMSNRVTDGKDALLTFVIVGNF